MTDPASLPGGCAGGDPPTCRASEENLPQGEENPSGAQA